MCKPPLSDEDIRRIAHSVARYPVGQTTVTLGGTPQDGAEALRPEEPAAAAVAANVEVTPLIWVDGDRFLEETIEPRKVFLRTITKKQPVFFGQSINQIFAWRGTGKTNVGLGLTKAFATAGSLLNWEVPEKVRVLYIEGELPEGQMQERWEQIVGKTNGYARLVTLDKQTDNIIPKLSTKAGKDKVEATLRAFEADGFHTDVLILDSISTLFNMGANDEDPWIDIQEWLIGLRSRGLSIIFLHHSGKGGLSRSHSKSEDMLDVSIKLEAPPDRDMDILHAIMTYDKVRAGLDEPSAEIKMRRVHSAECPCQQSEGTVIGCRGDSVAWEYRPTVDMKRSQANQMFLDGASLGDVAKHMKVPRATVQSWKKKFDESGVKLGKGNSE